MAVRLWPARRSASGRRGRPEEYWTSDYAYSLTEFGVVCVCFGGWHHGRYIQVYVVKVKSKYEPGSAAPARSPLCSRLLSCSRQSTSAQGLEVHEVVGGQHISHTSVRKFY